MATRGSHVRESRPYDVVYDPVFTWSGDRMRRGPIPAWNSSVNHLAPPPPRPAYRPAPRQNLNAQSNFQRTQLAQTMVVPAIMPDGTIGRVTVPKPAPQPGDAPPLPRIRGARGMMAAEKVAGQLNSEVLGRSRAKFFKRPVVPFLGEGGFDVGAGGAGDSVQADEIAAAEEAARIATSMDPDSQASSAEQHRTIGTQSDYRESEAQTDPYTPDYITDPSEPDPEVLGLAHLNYGNGLPASMDELQQIERMREKRAWEATLPPITDAASFEKRKVMLEARELQEWAWREEEMKEEQEAKLQLLVDTLSIREQKNEELNEMRVEAVRQAKLAERDKIFDSIHALRIKQTRALGKARQALDASTAHMSGGSKALTSSQVQGGTRRTNMRDIVGDYADHASQVYAPITREGHLPAKNQVVDYGIPILNSFQGLSELERQGHIPERLLEVAIKAPRRDRIQIASLATRKGQAIRRDLEYVDSLLDAQRAAGLEVGITGAARTNYALKAGQRLIENVYKKFEPVQRAPTPSVQPPKDEEATRAILLLQRILRGRMVQNAMYEGKAHHKTIIQELRKEEMEVEEAEEDEDEPLHSALDTLQGELLSSGLDTLRKEVVRVDVEGSVSSLVSHAKLTRRHREAEESGRRQAETLLRMKQERQFREIMAEHSRTATRFIDQLMSNAVEHHAQKTAQHLASSAVNKNESVDSSLQHVDIDRVYTDGPSAAAVAASSSSSASIVGDLVASFVLPEVERRRRAREEEVRQRRFVKEAHRTIFEAVADITGYHKEQEGEGVTETQQAQ